MPNKIIRWPWKSNNNNNNESNSSRSSSAGPLSPISTPTPSGQPSNDELTVNADRDTASVSSNRTVKHLSMSAPPRFMDLPSSSLSSPEAGSVNLRSADGSFSGNGPDASSDSSSGYATPRSFRSIFHNDHGVLRRSSTTFLRGPGMTRTAPKISDSHKKRPWKETPKHPWFVTAEQTMMYNKTKERIAQALSCALDMGGDLAHNGLFVGVKLLEYSPIPGLEAVGRVLLRIWDAMQQVALNRMRCLRLALRAADFLISIREEIAQLDDTVGIELQVPLRTFKETLSLILTTLHRHINLPGLDRYLKKEKLSEEIEHCKEALNDCLRSFDRSVMLRIVENLVKLRETSKTSNPPLLLQSDDGESPKPLDVLDIPVSNLPPSSDADTAILGDIFAEEPFEEKIEIWRRLVEAENKEDHAQDERDYHNLLEHAIHARDDAEVFRLLQIGHSELPIALKGLLKDALEMRRVKDEKKATHNHSRRSTRERCRSQTWPRKTFEAIGSRHDHESILQSVESMRREHRGLPSIIHSWTVAREDVRLGDIIGRGRFSTVFKGLWRGHTVAIKVLNPKMVSKTEFDNELTVWRTLSRNASAKTHGMKILELCGSSAFAGELPRMLLSPYMRHGNLLDYLKRCEWEAMGDSPALFLQAGSYTDVRHLDLMRDIARGMEFIHESGIVHGDLRVSKTQEFEIKIKIKMGIKKKNKVTFT
ncbi:hypothetical protein AX15_005422 [Amanita polypyramis BW_CC]|nr:hypothetical protein AX15_005422 [Amanita polypyramis BW_CC]